MEVSHRNKGLTFGESDWPYIETLLFTKTDAPFPDLSHFSGLSKLFLTDTRMEGLSLKENINLKLLDMRNCPVDTIPELVYEIESLEQFTFRHTAITTFPVERLTAMKNLSHLDLSANYILKKEVVDRARPILDKHGITYRFSQ